MIENKLILHTNPETGNIVICIPVPDCGLTIEQIAAKDVPYGQPYLIIDREDLPIRDTTFMAALEGDFSQPQGEGQNWGTGSMYDVVGWNNDGTPKIQSKG